MKMELEKILLHPDELPIFESGDEITFFMPIYPPLLRNDVKIRISPEKLFAQAVKETEKALGHSPKNFYEITFWENGLASEMMLTGHIGLLISVTGRYVLPPKYVKFDEEKRKAYSTAEKGVKYLGDSHGPPFGYYTKNITNNTQATLLKNWSIHYLNEAIKEVLRI